MQSVFGKQTEFWKFYGAFLLEDVTNYYDNREQAIMQSKKEETASDSRTQRPVSDWD
jgi:hypothetical protein